MTQVLQPGVRVRFVGQPQPFRNVVCLLLVGRTGTIRAPSPVPGMDWDVEMDEGCYDIDAHASTLVPLEDQRPHRTTATEESRECHACC
ncbi:hypothetical protein L3067_04145 [Xanthomonas sp. PPL568]|uniref:hypothetical protein n=1 Tax=Xanthomonas indica TaxID=2912242 RepID=UPI001F5A97AB|nr:hypothetical protein [Xanthomonas indica]MCI2243798.1 hypothetical protein [Xanthomonas indica]